MNSTVARIDTPVAAFRLARVHRKQKESSIPVKGQERTGYHTLQPLGIRPKKTSSQPGDGPALHCARCSRPPDTARGAGNDQKKKMPPLNRLITKKHIHGQTVKRKGYSAP